MTCLYSQNIYSMTYPYYFFFALRYRSLGDHVALRLCKIATSPTVADAEKSSGEFMLPPWLPLPSSMVFLHREGLGRLSIHYPSPGLSSPLSPRRLIKVRIWPPRITGACLPSPLNI